jgi:hypothetical protein
MGGTRAISPREQDCSWGSRPSIEYDGGRGGRIITPPIGWLEDYWMGRFYGMIAPPADDDHQQNEIPPSALNLPGAAAYNGPPRPRQLSK